MLFCLAVVAEPDAAKWPRRGPMAGQEQSGAFGTGSWTDTSPPNGYRIATKVAIWELAENPVACEKRLDLERRAASFGSRMGTC
jgi:hypothetical protein